MHPKLRRWSSIAALAALMGCTQGGTPPNGAGGGPAAGAGVEVLDADALPEAGRGQSLYVPVYASIATGNNSHPQLLAVTVSVRNTDPEHPIVVKRADYHDADGQLVRSDLPRPIRLAPMASTSFFLAESEPRGGSGASYRIDWEGPRGASSPAVESLMVRTVGSQGLSFTSQARVVREWNR
ncbi:MAG: DUF3124 domain-containing protein [Isosphaeraceae bacterium]